MGYSDLVNKYTKVTSEIGYIEELMKKDKDLALVRKLETLRVEQKDLKYRLDRYNGVNNDDR